MCVHVNTLPDDCLLPIFDRISLSELLHLDQVCPRWAKLLSSACARRRTLVLIKPGIDLWEFEIPLNNIPEMSFDCFLPYFDLPAAVRDASLALPFFMPNDIEIDDHIDEPFTELARLRRARLSGQLFTYLTELFPKVNTLMVIHGDCDTVEFNWLIHLLRHCNWPVTILKLWILTHMYFDMRHNRLPVEDHPVCALLQSINQQASLRQLTLNINGDGKYLLDHLTAESFSFITRLNELKLSLGWYGTDGLKFSTALWDIVHRFDHTGLRNIALLDHLNHSERRLEIILNPKYAFTTKVSQIHEAPFKTFEQFDEFCWRYPSVTALAMYWPEGITFAQLVTKLASLTQLTYLKLNISCRHAMLALSDYADADEEPIQISLPQVKSLVVSGFFHSHRYFESLSPMLFPSVKTIVLDRHMRECFICQPGKTFRQLEGACRAMSKQCHRLLILSVKNKFANSLVQIFSCDLSLGYVDWSNYVRTEEDDLFETSVNSRNEN